MRLFIFILYNILLSLNFSVDSINMLYGFCIEYFVLMCLWDKQIFSVPHDSAQGKTIPNHYS